MMQRWSNFIVFVWSQFDGGKIDNITLINFSDFTSTSSKVVYFHQLLGAVLLMFNLFIWSFQFYKNKQKEKTSNNDKCFIQLWLMPLLGLLLFSWISMCIVFNLLAHDFLNIDRSLRYIFRPALVCCSLYTLFLITIPQPLLDFFRCKFSAEIWHSIWPLDFF